MYDNKKKLTPKMERFCHEYLVDLNASQAAIRAGYSKESAGSMGYENINKPEIQNRLAELAAERNRRTQIDADYVLLQAQKIHEATMDRGLYQQAISSLKLVGDHVAVGAFKQMQNNVSVTIENRTLDDFYKSMDDDE